MSIKSKLLVGATGIIPAAIKPPEEPKGADVVLTSNGDTMQPGDVVKVKQKDKTKSPYSVVTGINHATKQVEMMNFCDTGAGNRAARRSQFAKDKS